MQSFVPFALGQEVEVKSSVSKNGRGSSDSGEASSSCGGVGGAESSGPVRSWFSLVLVLALVGLWSSMAVVYFDVVDYDSVLGKLSAYDSDGDGDFDLEDARVLLDETSPGPNSTERLLRGVRLRSALKQELRDLHRLMEAKRVTEILLRAFREALKDEDEETTRRERVRPEQTPEQETDEKSERFGKTRRHSPEKQRKSPQVEIKKKSRDERRNGKYVDKEKSNKLKKNEKVEAGKPNKQKDEKMKSQTDAKEKNKKVASEKEQIIKPKDAIKVKETAKIEKERLSKETKAKELQQKQDKDKLEKEKTVPEAKNIVEERKFAAEKERKDEEKLKEQDKRTEKQKETERDSKVQVEKRQTEKEKIMNVEREQEKEQQMKLKPREEERKQEKPEDRGTTGTEKETKLDQAKPKLIEEKVRFVKAVGESEESGSFGRKHLAETIKVERELSSEAELKQSPKKLKPLENERTVKESEESARDAAQNQIKPELETKKDTIESEFASKKQEETLNKQKRTEEEKIAKEFSSKKQDGVTKTQTTTKVKATSEPEKLHGEEKKTMDQHEIEKDKSQELHIKKLPISKAKLQTEQTEIKEKIIKESEQVQEKEKASAAKKESERDKVEQDQTEKAEAKEKSEMEPKKTVSDGEKTEKPATKLRIPEAKSEIGQKVVTITDEKQKIIKLANEDGREGGKQLVKKVVGEREAKEQNATKLPPKAENEQNRATVLGQAKKVVSQAQTIKKTEEPPQIVNKEEPKNKQTEAEVLKIQTGKAAVSGQSEKMITKTPAVKTTVGQERTVKVQNETQQHLEKPPIQQEKVVQTPMVKKTEQEAKVKEQDGVKPNLKPQTQHGKTVNLQQTGAISGQTGKIEAQTPTVKKEQNTTKPATRDLNEKNLQEKVMKLQQAKVETLGEEKKVVAPQMVKSQQTDKERLVKETSAETGTTAEAKQVMSAILGRASGAVAKEEVKKIIGNAPVVRAETEPTKSSVLRQAVGVVAKGAPEQQKISPAETGTRNETKQAASSSLGQTSRVVTKEEVKTIVGNAPVVRAEPKPLRSTVLRQAVGVVAKAAPEQQKIPPAETKQATSSVLVQTGRVVAKEADKKIVGNAPVVRAQTKPMKSSILGQVVGVAAKGEDVQKIAGKEPVVRAETEQMKSSILGQTGRVVAKEEVKTIVGKEPVVRAETKPVRSAVLGQAVGVVGKGAPEQQKISPAETGTRNETKQAASSGLGQTGPVVAKEEVKKIIGNAPVVRAETKPVRSTVLGQAVGVISKAAPEQQKISPAETKQTASSVLGQTGRVVAKEAVKTIVGNEPVVRTETEPTKLSVLRQAGRVVAKGAPQQQKISPAETGTRNETKQAASSVLGQTSRVVTKEAVKTIVGNEPLSGAETKPVKSSVLGQAVGEVGKGEVVKKIVGNAPVVRAETEPTKTSILRQAVGVVAKAAPEQQKISPAETKQTASSVLGQAGRVVAKEEVKKIVGNEPLVRAETKPIKSSILGQTVGVVGKEAVKKIVGNAPVFTAETKPMKSTVLGKENEGSVAKKTVGQEQNRTGTGRTFEKVASEKSVDNLAKTKTEQETVVKLQSVKQAPKDVKQPVKTITEPQQTVKVPKDQPERNEKVQVIKKLEKETTKAPSTNEENVKQTQVVEEKEQMKVNTLGLAKKQTSKEPSDQNIVQNATKPVYKPKTEQSGHEQISKGTVHKMIGQNKQNATRSVSKVEFSEQTGTGAVREQEKTDGSGKGDKNVLAKGAEATVRPKSKSETVKLQRTAAGLEKQPQTEVIKKQVVQKAEAQDRPVKLQHAEKEPAKATVLKQVESK
ncbi:hypothetical protein NL108_013794 [Boleophthalmus pectinirostris]|nr:hypothetical protein NL108_013794 [Boleophthalmus pectinirostris]